MGKAYINSDCIKNFFDGLNNSGVIYMLIKNIGNELPDCLIHGKDIDIIVHPESMLLFHNYMKKVARKVIHPYGCENGWRNIYGLGRFEFWRLKTADDIYIDVTEKLCCQSLMPKIWVPLDNQIQEAIWRNRLFDEKNNWWRMDDNVLYVYLIIRCVFDKKKFSDAYRREIEVLRHIINQDVVIPYFQLVFFRFTTLLLAMLEEKEYNNIIPSYISFKDY